MIQLLDRHNRDSAALAWRLGVPLHVVPASLPGTPFRFLPVFRGRWWKEVALWWPERRILVCADALGTIPFYRAGDELAGLHPFFRLKRPRAWRGSALSTCSSVTARASTAWWSRRRSMEASADGPAAGPRWLAGIPRVMRKGY